MNFKIKKFLIFFLLLNNFFSKDSGKFVSKFVSSIFGLFTSGYIAFSGTSKESKNLAYISVIQSIKEIVEIFSENFFNKDENEEENKNTDEIKRNRYFLKKNILKFENDSIKIFSQLFNNSEFIKILEKTFCEINLKLFESPENIRNFIDQIIPKIVQPDQ